STEESTELAATNDASDARVASVRPFPAHHPGSSAIEPEERDWRRLAPFAILVLLIAAGALTWWLLRDPAAPAPQSKVTAPLELSQVDVSVVQPRVLTRLLPLSGSLSPVVQATVKSKVGGEVKELTVREG